MFRLPLDKTSNVAKPKEVISSLDYIPFGRKVTILVLFTLAIASLLGLFTIVNNNNLIEVPVSGGSFTEAIVGSPRFVNPLLAVSDADQDLSILIYSGLVRPDKDGNYVGDLAESYTVSEDGLEYTFVIREDAVFHDNESVTADDVIMTIHLAQNPSIKSARRADWEGIEVESVGERVVKFTLKKPYAPFIENTTMGILPEHIWGDVDESNFAFSSFNLEAIGSGPYEVSSIRSNRSGIASEYKLKSFKDFALGEAYLDEISLRFYPDEAAAISAYNAGEVDSIGTLSPLGGDSLRQAGIKTTQVLLPRVFGVFFNQNQAQILSDKRLREALELATPRSEIVEASLLSFGQAVDGPVAASESVTSKSASSTEEAIAKLEAAGWELGEDGVREKDGQRLSISLSTSAAPVLESAAGLLVQAWSEIGFDVELRVFELSDLNQSVIRPRDFDALLFGTVIGRFPDPFAFYHSSQRLDPGLNVAQYTSTKADGTLEEARIETNRNLRANILLEFAEAVAEDIPAVFIYSPELIYLTPGGVKGVDLVNVAGRKDRFLYIYEWYKKTDRTWPALTHLSI